MVEAVDLEQVERLPDIIGRPFLPGMGDPPQPATMSFVNNSRMSVYSTASASASRPGNPPSQTSTTTLLNTLNSAYKNGRSYNLEASTSLVVNTWVNAKSIIDDRTCEAITQY